MCGRARATRVSVACHNELTSIGMGLLLHWCTSPLVHRLVHRLLHRLLHWLYVWQPIDLTYSIDNYM